MSRTYSLVGALCGLAAIGAMSEGRIAYKPRPLRYSRFCGPPHPTTRQQLRALQRAAKSAVAKIKAKA